jgi:hypothetical protein
MFWNYSRNELTRRLYWRWIHMYLPTAVGSKHNTVSTIDLTAPAVTRVHWPHTHTQKLKILTDGFHKIRTRCGAQESDAMGWAPSPALNYCYRLFFLFFCDWYRCFLLGTISLLFGIVAPRVDDIGIDIQLGSWPPAWWTARRPSNHCTPRSLPCLLAYSLIYSRIYFFRPKT